jgi:hypothetical protein
MVLFLFGVEAIQIQNLTWKIYKTDSMNFVELSQYCFALVYIVFRFIEMDELVIPLEENTKDARRIQWWVIANTILFSL